jgi:hypothetical protein
MEQRVVPTPAIKHARVAAPPNRRLVVANVRECRAPWATAGAALGKKLIIYIGLIHLLAAENKHAKLV